ncbi:TPA: DUF2326 domain-containing protein [Streptococcus suis]|nr:DUF2326 domain-containing protein [Streptococcus suis]HEM2709508.1 DUF2326 domain-containing protein [Streptococcus suis]HEM2732192.1 DUF2326 domain-containing protein [Streptococcus suis]
MLIEMWSPAFKKEGEIREPIKFHLGLNVVMGMDNADNSIGKSSTLLAIDFIFGGTSYLKSVAVKKVGDHPIYFSFKFDKTYYFSRDTENSEKIIEYKNGYDVIDKTHTKDDYMDFLKDKYDLNNKGLSFRLGVSGFFRIAGKSNQDLDYPLKVYSSQSSEGALTTLIQLFDYYDDIEIYREKLTESKNKLKAFKEARKYNFISNLIGGQKQFELNAARIKELEYQLSQLQEDEENLRINSQDLENSKQKIKLKNQKLELEKLMLDKQRRLKLLDISLEYGLYPTEADVSSLQEFFPSVEVKKIFEIEKYHKKLAKILDSEFSNEKEQLTHELKQIEDVLQNTNIQLSEIGASTHLSADFLDKYTELTSTINALKEQNKAYLDENKLNKIKLDADKDLKRSIEEILVELQSIINAKMREFNDVLYPDVRKSPQITLKAYNSYSFHTPDDDGTGTKFKGVLVLDLAILYLTNLPILAHDSLLFKNISDQAIAGLVKLYTQTAKLGKQVFIAIDKTASYGSETEKVLKDNTVLRLSDNGNELFGISWSKGANENES